MKPSSQELNLIVRALEGLCGISLDDGKKYLIEDRLVPIMKDFRIASFFELYTQIQKSADRQLRIAIIDAITTNETLFFRDDAHYALLSETLIPDIVKRRSESSGPKRIRIWSSACSTGQEPFSLAMILAEQVPRLGDWDVEILATDISEAALERARAAWYTNLEITRGISPGRRARHFTPMDGGWKLRENSRSLVTFRSLNLLQPFSFLGQFDLILCRNVAIYFKTEVRAQLFKRLAQVLGPEGALVTGGSEALDDLQSEFEAVRSGGATFYRSASGEAVRGVSPVTPRH